MWICFPAKKLCAHCFFTNPGYLHVGLNEGRKACGLTSWDVEGLSIINSTCTYLTSSDVLVVKNSVSDHPTVLPIVLPNSLNSIALEKGISPSKTK